MSNLDSKLHNCVSLITATAMMDFSVYYMPCVHITGHFSTILKQFYGATYQNVLFIIEILDNLKLNNVVISHCGFWLIIVA